MKAIRMGSRVGVISVFLILASSLVLVTAVFAEWKANDDSNDDPDSVHKWFAPMSTIHISWWWDVDGAGEMDQVLDDDLYWESDISTDFSNNPDKNLVHELQTYWVVYEAEDWYWTDLPAPDKNDDSNFIEEDADDYEEKELGWLEPAQQIPAASDRMIYTGWMPYNDSNTYFLTESELTQDDGDDPWDPYAFDELGYMEIVGAE